jgi:hypothetical protein
MIKAMGKTYKTGKPNCRKMTDGKKICVSKKAWSVFFGKVTKEYGRGAEEKPRSRSKSVGESEKPSELEKDIFIEWFLEDIKDENKKKEEDKK